MKLEDFEPTVYRPAVYTVNMKRLHDSDLVVRSNDGLTLTTSYNALRTSLLAEEVIECNWHSSMTMVRTKKAQYERPVDAKTSEAIWQILCLDCHLVMKRGSSVANATWFFYSHGSSPDSVSISEGYFVVLDGDPAEIIDSKFGLHAHAPEEDPSVALTKAGVWEPLGPVEVDQADEFSWPNDAAWRIGAARARYKYFYENTDVGRAASMAPLAERFDELRFWVEIVEPSEARPPELLSQIRALETRVAWLQSVAKMVIAVGAILVVATWIWR